jgi:tetratricopeptide (TPR) repeat protein/serine/threonine protein kinase
MPEQPLSERSIFEAALDKATPGERAAFLDQACGADQALRREVEALLAVHDRLAVTGEDPLAGERTGSVIGPYKLLQQIGEGGMGSVFMAEQTSPVQRKVALKLIKAGMDSKQVIARFEAERQALALMDHPNIARVLDAGETGGSPYFVMELVKGVPITHYCDQHHLTPRHRLELFEGVCQAVQHAHTKGIIHRDLKPSNVLVACYDSLPVPKVIDFGVAKATGPKLTERTLFTEFGAVVGTLEYMSPEQAELNQLDVDTRSDIYSLGVVLYELLTGTTPLQRKRIEGTGLLEVLRLIREEEPPKPSTRLNTTEELPAIAANRGTEPARLTRLVRGELDWIVMKCLEKDRNRRYETASALARDLERYLDDEPVLACPPSAGYRLRKFARRHRRALASAALVLLCLILLGGGVGWVLRDRAGLRHEATETLGEVEEAYRRDRLAEAAVVVGRARSLAARGGADSQLWRRIEQWEHDLALARRLEEIRLEVRSVWAVQSFDLAAADEAYRQAFQGYDLDVEALSPEEAAGYIKTALIRDHLLAALYDWLLVKWSQKQARAERLLEVARQADEDPWRERLRQAFQREDREALKRLATGKEVLAQPPATMHFLGAVLAELREYSAAADALRPMQRKHPSDFWLNWTLSFVLISGKPTRYAEAEGFLRAALVLRPESSVVHSHLSLTLFHQDRTAEAEAQCLEALRLRPDSAVAHNHLGAIFFRRGQFDRAEAAYRTAIRCMPEFAIAHDNLGSTLVKMGKLPEAEAELRLGIRLRPDFGRAHGNLGLLLLKKGNLPEAETECREAVRLEPELAWTHASLGRVLAVRSKNDEAEREYRESLRLQPADAENHTMLGAVLAMQKRFDEAVVEFREAVRLKPDHARAHGAMGHILKNQGKLADAEVSYREAIRFQPDWPEVRFELGVIHQRKGRLADAAAQYREAIRLNSRLFPARSNLAAVLATQGKLAQAEAEIRQAILLQRNSADAHYNLGLILEKRGRLEEAITAYSKVIELQPSSASRCNNLAWLLATCLEPAFRNARRAVELARRAVELAPKQPTYWTTLGVAQYRAGDWKAASAALAKSMELRKSGNVSAWLFQAMARWQLGQKEEPRRWYDRVSVWLDQHQPANDELRRFQAEAAELLGIAGPARGRSCAERGEWKQAAADYAVAFEREPPKDPFIWFEQACLRLQLGDVDGYRNLCGRMRERFGASKSVDDIALLAQACAQAPGALDEPAAVLRLAEQRLNLTPPSSGHHSWSVHVLGLAQYRAGQYQKAVHGLSKAVKDDPDWEYQVGHWLVLSMAHHRLGHGEEARKLFDRAEQWVGERTRGRPAGSRLAPPPWSWREWLGLQMLRREAGELLKKQEE